MRSSRGRSSGPGLPLRRLLGSPAFVAPPKSLGLPRLMDHLRGAAGLLTYPAPPERYVGLLARRGSRFRARVEAVVPETERATTLWLRPGRDWPSHLPGQWVPVEVEVDGVRHSRCYSITTAPGGELIAITVQAVPGGRVSGVLAHRTGVGDHVVLGPPEGGFTREGDDTEPVLFVTGGSGITPVMSMLRTAARDGGLADAVLLHHAPGADDSLFTAELEELDEAHPGLRVERTWTGTADPPPEARLTAERLDRTCPDWRERDAYVCGPAPLLDAAARIWEEAGFAERLNVERFVAAVAPVDGGAVPGRVRFDRTGGSAPSDGRKPLLDVIEEAGRSVRSGCRVGVCRTCVTRLQDGSVVDLRDGRVTEGSGALVQICVNAARGDVRLDL